MMKIQINNYKYPHRCVMNEPINRFQQLRLKALFLTTLLSSKLIVQKLRFISKIQIDLF